MAKKYRYVMKIVKTGQRLRYRIICWLLQKLSPLEFAHLHFEWERQSRRCLMGRTRIIYRQEETDTSPEAVTIGCPFCHTRLTEEFVNKLRDDKEQRYYDLIFRS